MLSTSQTTSALLAGLRTGGDSAVWGEFAERYRPVVIGVARRLGLSESDAEDAAQETLAEFFEAYRAGRFDRTRGRLRSWLLGMARFRIEDVRRRGRRDAPGAAGLSGVEADEARLSALWEEEHRRAILDRAVSQLRQDSRIEERTLRAFELSARQGRDASDVAAALGMSRDEVYVAKHRVLERLREIVAELTTAYEQDAP